MDAKAPSFDSPYAKWTRESLLAHIKSLEEELQKNQLALPPLPSLARPEGLAKKKKNKAEANGTPGAGEDGQKPAKKAKVVKDIDPSKYNSRYIALKFAYQGKRYGGFEYQESQELPTIEDELWKALTCTRLIYPKDANVVDFDCCEYSKCGRTDRGVSAFGQVVTLRVRSNRPLPKPEGSAGGVTEAMEIDSTEKAPEKEWDPIRDEIRYCSVLNRVLPPDIRILAWYPDPPADFVARFSCRERQYRYFFTQPAYAPIPGPLQNSQSSNGWLDIDRMRNAAKHFQGSHDFRNFCKADPSKLRTNYTRTMFEVDVVEVPEASTDLAAYMQSEVLKPEAGPVKSEGLEMNPRGTKVYYFSVKGSAFLWHQIRCMVYVLFLVGQGLEEPSVILDLLDVEKTPARPAYPMADDVPLVLWDCIFPVEGDAERRDAVPWVWADADEQSALGFSRNGNIEALWSEWRGKKMDEMLAAQLLLMVSKQGQTPKILESKERAVAVLGDKTLPPRIFEGGNAGFFGPKKYIPLEKLKKGIPVDEANDAYARKNGYKDAQEMRLKRGYREAE
ncbi:putative tRNA pseudouridine synthase C25B8.05 [Ceratocystis platani]|uniref:Putative tRNA pseudouridine synthase C25B8.05 n=1 Tax=Ceratocystis fimbriata f. sp. platani TaxID=88771 RepID=A0A0F8CS96_CERFI|nr:putative tRNA pseudouridine synthase C25B8.05 [Ceratocystis platani]